MFNFIKKLFGKDKYSKFIKSYVPLSEKEMPYYVDPELKSERDVIRDKILIILNNAGQPLHHREIYKFPSVNSYENKKFISVLYNLATKGHISYAKEKGKGFFKINEEQFKFSK